MHIRVHAAYKTLFQDFFKSINNCSYWRKLEFLKFDRKSIYTFRIAFAIYTLGNLHISITDINSCMMTFPNIIIVWLSNILF